MPNDDYFYHLEMMPNRPSNFLYRKCVSEGLDCNTNFIIIKVNG